MGCARLRFCYNIHIHWNWSVCIGAFILSLISRCYRIVFTFSYESDISRFSLCIRSENTHIHLLTHTHLHTHTTHLHTPTHTHIYIYTHMYIYIIYNNKAYQSFSLNKSYNIIVFTIFPLINYLLIKLIKLNMILNIRGC